MRVDWETSCSLRCLRSEWKAVQYSEGMKDGEKGATDADLRVHWGMILFLTDRGVQFTNIQVSKYSVKMGTLFLTLQVNCF